MKVNTVVNWTIGLVCTVLVSACNDDEDEPVAPIPTPTINFTQVSGSGDITAKLTEFRTLLGDPLNTTLNQTAGRREINWDGVPANLTNVDTYPGDFFNSTDPAVGAGRKRGAVFTTPGTGFRISDNDFTDIVADYGNQFNAFSPARTFVAVGSNQTDVTFRLPGTNTPATVKGFGAIFSDVDNANSTTLEFFEGDKSLGTFKAPVRNDVNGFSFVGVKFPDNRVSKVVIKSGNVPLSSRFADGSQYDLVIMDDFLYDEPTASN
ncbi:hypothetical protein [Fibrisoma limi]|nr:hypothetical protein [Fibrisoma limi]